MKPREWQLLSLVASGASNKMIAERVRRSEKTVEYHLGKLYARFGVRSRTALLAEAAQRGFLPTRRSPALAKDLSDHLALAHGYTELLASSTSLPVLERDMAKKAFRAVHELAVVLLGGEHFVAAGDLDPEPEDDDAERSSA